MDVAPLRIVPRVLFSLFISNWFNGSGPTLFLGLYSLFLYLIGLAPTKEDIDDVVNEPLAGELKVVALVKKIQLCKSGKEYRVDMRVNMMKDRNTSTSRK